MARRRNSTNAAIATVLAIAVIAITCKKSSAEITSDNIQGVDKPLNSSVVTITSNKFLSTPLHSAVHDFLCGITKLLNGTDYIIDWSTAGNANASLPTRIEETCIDSTTSVSSAASSTSPGTTAETADATSSAGTTEETTGITISATASATIPQTATSLASSETSTEQPETATSKNMTESLSTLIALTPSTPTDTSVEPTDSASDMASSMAPDTSTASTDLTTTDDIHTPDVTSDDSTVSNSVITIIGNTVTDGTSIDTMGTIAGDSKTTGSSSTTLQAPATDAQGLSTSTETTKEPPASGLSDGAVVGIVLGSLFGAALVVGSSVLIVRRLDFFSKNSSSYNMAATNGFHVEMYTPNDENSDAANIEDTTE